MKISARNRLKGKIVEMRKGATTAHVRLDVSGTIVTASITNEAVDEFGLKVGGTAYAIVKARYVGVSNWPAHKIARALGRSELRNVVRADSAQPHYNLLFHGFERDLLPHCEEEGIAVVPYNPLAGGMLTGKHSAKAPPPEGSRFQLGTAGARYQERYWHAREFETIDALRTVAAQAGMTMATMAMRWVISNTAITAPIVGASKPEQLADSFAAAEQGALPKDLEAKLDEITREWRAVDAER